MNLFQKLLPDGWVDESTPPSNEAPQEKVVEQPQPKRSATIDLSSTISSKREVVETERVAPAANLGIISMPGKPDPEYIKTILNFLEEKNMEGIDYYEFSSAVREMIESGTPVEQAFRNTFIAFKSGGLTIDKLIDANLYYQKQLQGLQQEFFDDADTKITNKEKEVKNSAGVLSSTQMSLQEEKTRITKRLTEIDEAYGKNETQLVQLNTELEKVVSSQSLRKSKMATANDYCIAAINGDLENIKTYLKK